MCATLSVLFLATQKWHFSINYEMGLSPLQGCSSDKGGDKALSLAPTQILLSYFTVINLQQI